MSAKMARVKTRTASFFTGLIAFAASAVQPAHAAPAKAPTAKPIIAGFIDMQDISWHNTDHSKPHFTLDNINMFRGLFGGIVFNGTWWEMQPKQGSGHLKTRRLGDALNQVRQYNLAHPDAPLGMKLRIYSGNQAPEWAKELAGGPITIKRNEQGCHQKDCKITIGKVWDPSYIAAWRQFQALLAAKYDSEPLIRSVAITSCAMETDEPFVMPTDQRVPKGYTDKAGKACLRGAVDDYAAWQQTPIDYTINPFLPIQEGGAADVKFSKSIMKLCRAELGDRCELGNHSLSNAMMPDDAKVVAAISHWGAPIHYQTEGPGKVGFKWRPIIRAARHYHGTAVELWPEATLGGFTSLSPKKMQKLLDLFNGQHGISPSQ
jgi:hypothetical protein